MNKLLLSVIITAVVVGAGAFYGGMKYGQGQVPQRGNFQQMAGAGLRGERVGNGAGGGFINGEIISKDDKSITIKLQDGSSKNVFYSGTTDIGKSMSGTSADLEIGKTVSINGKVNSDGSITAQSIQLRTAFRAAGN